MIDLADLEAFHFLRPLWLWLLPVFPLIAWRVRGATSDRDEVASFVAVHLSDALTVGGERRRGFQPVDGAVVVGVLAALAAAGPSWTRIANPLANDVPVMVIALEVSETMLAVDVEPTRLERARHKIRDLLELRSGARTALVAYAGTAHRVLPPTEDPEIIRRFVDGLSPDVMPRGGQDATAAIAIARKILAEENESGVILFVGDGFDPADLDAFRSESAAAGPQVMALVLGSEEGGAILAPGGGFASDAEGRRRVDRVDDRVLARFESEGGVEVVRASVERSDLRRIDRESRAALRAHRQQDDQLGWEDRGWVLLWPAALFALLWFRRGWTTRWAGTAILLLAASTAASPAQAGEIAEIFFTPDQRARWAFEHGRPSEAGDLFEDAQWKGYALAEAGRYLEAADAFGRVLGPDALFAMGNALVKGREYRRAIDAYQQALAEDPGHEGAANNLLLAQTILRNLTKQRAEEDRGDGSEGADEIRFDSESKDGQTITITKQTEMTLESEEAWMRTVDPGIAEFLRIRFDLDLIAGDDS